MLLSLSSKLATFGDSCMLTTGALFVFGWLLRMPGISHLGKRLLVNGVGPFIERIGLFKLLFTGGADVWTWSCSPPLCLGAGIKVAASGGSCENCCGPPLPNASPGKCSLLAER